MSDLVEGTRWGHRHQQVRGERHGGAKLTTADVAMIRERFRAEGVSHASLARAYGVSRSLVGKIIRRERWRHIADMPLVGSERVVEGPHRKVGYGETTVPKGQHRKVDPIKHCQSCGVEFTRGRGPSGKLERHQDFVTRVYCSSSCSGGSYAARMRAIRATRGEPVVVLPLAEM